MSNETKNVHEFLTYPEAAELLRITPQSLRRLVMQKKVPACHPFGPGRVLFDAAELRDLVRSSRVAPKSENLPDSSTAGVSNAKHPS